MAEDFGPEDLARASSRDFLKEEKDGFPCSGSFGESLVMIRLPTDSPNFGRGGRVGSRTSHEGGKQKGEEKLHLEIRRMEAGNYSRSGCRRVRGSM